MGLLTFCAESVRSCFICEGAISMHNRTVGKQRKFLNTEIIFNEDFFVCVHRDDLREVVLPRNRMNALA